MKNQGNKWWPWILALVLLINLGTLGFFWLNHFHQRRVMMGGRELKEYIAGTLEFNAQQKMKFLALVKVHQDQSARIRSEIAKAKIEYYRFEGGPEQNALALNKLKNAYGKLDELNYAHFEEIRGLCKADQLKLFDQLLTKILISSDFGFSGPELKR